jgi:hypothetical protein
VIEVAFVERGCGEPAADSMYWMIPTSPDGVPIEYYLLDPLKRIPAGIKIRKRGLTLIQVGEVWHVVDHVGSGPYPNALDWFYEAKAHKFHQKIDSNLDFSKLDKTRSWYFVVHDRVIPVYPDIPGWYEEWNEAEDLIVLTCIQGRENHDRMWQGATFPHEEWEPCASLLWTDIIQGEFADERDARLRKVHRKTVSVEYTGYCLDADEPTKWARGFFAAFPLSIMQSIIYPGRDGKVTDKKLKQIREGGWVDPIEFARAVKL